MSTSSGWFIFRAEEEAQEADMSDPTTMERVRSYVRNFQRGRMEDWAIDQAEYFIELANEIGFAAALARQDLENRSFGPIPLNFGDIDLFSTLASQFVAELGASASDENFWRTAFATPINTPSHPLVQGGNVFILYPTAETQSEESSIEGIVSTANSFWINHTTEQALNQHFLNSPRFEDNFNDVYFRFFWGE